MKFIKSKLILPLLTLLFYSPVLLFQGCGTTQKYEKYNCNENNVFQATSVDISNITGSAYNNGSSSDGKIDLGPILYVICLPGYIIDLIPSLAVDIVTSPYDIYATLKYKNDIQFWNNVATKSLYNLPSEEYLGHVSEHFVGNYLNYYNTYHLQKDIQNRKEFTRVIATAIRKNNSIISKTRIPFFPLHDQSINVETLQFILDYNIPFNIPEFLKHQNSNYTQRYSIVKGVINSGSFVHCDFKLIRQSITPEDLAKLLGEFIKSDQCSDYLLRMAYYKIPELFPLIWKDVYEYYKREGNDSFWSFTTIFKTMPFSNDIFNEAFPFSDKDQIKQYYAWQKDIGSSVFYSHYLKERVQSCVNILNNPHTPESFKKRIASKFDHIAFLHLKILAYSALKKYIADESIPEQLAAKLCNGSYDSRFGCIPTAMILKNTDLDEDIAKYIRKYQTKK